MLLDVSGRGKKVSGRTKVIASSRVRYLFKSSFFHLMASVSKGFGKFLISQVVEKSLYYGGLCND